MAGIIGYYRDGCPVIIGDRVRRDPSGETGEARWWQRGGDVIVSWDDGTRSAIAEGSLSRLDATS